jgi:aryl-alcohol dehydrogenase-like predicted oxidoreductase
MQYRTLGRTGASVSEFIFGCGNVGGMMIRQPYDAMRTAAADAIAAGMNWFDTAAMYGDGKSEENLGRVLRDLKAQVHVSTKGTVNADSTEPYADQMARTFNESSTRLGYPIDLFQLHGRVATDGAPRSLTPEQILRPNGILDAMERLRDHGKYKWLGITGLGETDAIIEVLSSGRLDTCQVYINAINPTASHKRGRTPAPATGQDFAGVIDTAKAKNIGVIAIRTLAAGALAGAPSLNARALLTSHTDLVDEVRKSDAIAAAFGAQYGTRAQIALRYALSVPGIDCIDFAIGEPEHLPEGLKALDLGPLPRAALDQLDAMSKSDFR